MPVKLQECTDAELVQRACDNQADAFAELMQRYQTLGFSLALHYAHQVEIAQDLVQEALLQAYLSLDHLHDPTRFKSWFYGIVLNVCRSWRRAPSLDVLSLDALAAYWTIPSPLDLEAASEAQERDQLVHQAVQALSPNNRRAMQMFYFEDRSLQEIAQILHLSLEAVKGRLHKGRQQLRRQLAALAPTMLPSSAPILRRSTMTTVQLVRVIPHELRILVLLLDAPQRRVLPLWLPRFEAAALQKFIRGPQLSDASPSERSEAEFITQLLQAGGVTIPAIHIELLQDQVLYAMLTISGSQGEQLLKSRVGHALILAQELGSAINVDEHMFEQAGIILPRDETLSLEDQVELLVQRLQANLPVPQQMPRIREPQNLDFTAGLARWELRGSFMHESAPTQWPDYACGTTPTGRHEGELCGYLQAQVAQPTGYADLRQAILADEMRGKRVRLAADLKTEDVTQQANLYLRVVDQARTKRSQDREQFTVQGTCEWARYETQIEVPDDGVFVLFGISLTGPGRLSVARVQLEVLA